MFTKGQWLFGILFALTFAILLVMAYKQDIKKNKRYFKGSVWILIAFISFILLITAIKFFLS